jgi:hypothetical protein
MVRVRTDIDAGPVRRAATTSAVARSDFPGDRFHLRRSPATMAAEDDETTVDESYAVTIPAADAR